MAYKKNNRPRYLNAVANTRQPMPNVPVPSQNSPLVLPGQPNPLNKPGLIPIFQYISNLYQQYIKDKVNVGYLKVYITSASGGKPIPNAKITISKPLGNNFFLAQIIFVDENGETAEVPLPTRSAELSQTPEYPVPYTIWNLTVEAPGYYEVVVYDVSIFPGVTTTQAVSLKPVEGGSAKPTEEIYASAKQLPISNYNKYELI